MQNKNFLSDIVFLRAISIVFVVAFHAYGMMYAAAHFPALKDTYYQMYFTLNQCVFINIAMPMFVFVSGYLDHIGIYGFCLCYFGALLWHI